MYNLLSKVVLVAEISLYSDSCFFFRTWLDNLTLAQADLQDVMHEMFEGQLHYIVLFNPCFSACLHTQ